MKKINGKINEALMFKKQSAKRALMFIPASSTNRSFLVNIAISSSLFVTFVYSLRPP